MKRYDDNEVVLLIWWIHCVNALSNLREQGFNELLWNLNFGHIVTAWYILPGGQFRGAIILVDNHF